MKIEDIPDDVSVLFTLKSCINALESIQDKMVSIYASRGYYTSTREIEEKIDGIKYLYERIMG
jgi:hypothetical protein